MYLRVVLCHVVLLNRQVKHFALADEAFQRLTDGDGTDTCWGSREDEVAHTERLEATYIGDQGIEAMDHLRAVCALYLSAIQVEGEGNRSLGIA